ncbi:MAG: hypothetical protein HQK91_13010 [Nitrospirae bacterium]|nr:hypothetical protein [Nitrospirota bacterium]
MKTIILISLLVITSLFYIFLSRDEKIEMIKVETDATMEDVTIINKKDAVIMWSAHVAKIIQPSKSAKSARSDNNYGDIILSDIKLNFKDKHLILNAKNGFYDINKGSIRLSDDITANFKDFTITADTVDWDSESLILCTSGSVKIFSEKFLITGDSLCSSPDNKIRLVGNVRASFFI